MRINQKIREFLYKKSKNGDCFLFFPEDLNKTSPDKSIFTSLLEGVIFVDLYKELHYKNITNKMTSKDYELLAVVDSIINFEDIHKHILTNGIFADSLFNASVNFYNASGLEKIAQVKSLKDDDKIFLKEILPSFDEDLEFYNRKIELETYFNYISKIKDYHERKKIAFNKETIIEQIVAFIKNLYSWDSENAIKNILDLALIDYKYSKQFLKLHKYPKVGNGKYKAELRIKRLENTEIEEIIAYAITDEYYLEELLDTYFYVRKQHIKAEEFEAVTECIEIDEKVTEKIKK